MLACWIAAAKVPVPLAALLVTVKVAARANAVSPHRINATPKILPACRILFMSLQPPFDWFLSPDRPNLRNRKSRTKRLAEESEKMWDRLKDLRDNKDGNVSDVRETSENCVRLSNVILLFCGIEKGTTRNA
jgi:hypothetical protein